MEREPEPPSILVAVELQLGVEPIGGRLTGAFNGTHAFAGWLDFVATLEAERRRALNPTDPPLPDPRPGYDRAER